MSAADTDPYAGMTNAEHSRLFSETCDLYRYVHGHGPGCLSGSTQELVNLHNDLADKAAHMDGPHPDAIGDDR